MTASTHLGTSPESKIILETDRLMIREMTEADVEPLLKVLGDPVAMRYYPAPYTREGVEGWVQRSQERYRTLGFGLWAVVLKDTGEMIGDCGLTLQTVLGHEELEIGYHIQREHQGKGFATEAARACLEWVFRNTSYGRIISLMNVENLPSRRVANKVHARFLGECGERAGLPHVYYGTERREFEGASNGRCT
jgi:RimJ/RimL family protein N-acetyltransferase